MNLSAKDNELTTSSVVPFSLQQEFFTFLWSFTDAVVIQHIVICRSGAQLAQIQATALFALAP